VNATVKQMIEEIRTELASGQELESIKDRSHEFIDGYLPVYYNRIVEEWKEMPAEYNDRGRAELGIGDDFTIYSLMSLDLYLYYTDLFIDAIEEVAGSLEEVSE
jgi:hypothetical protein